MSGRAASTDKRPGLYALSVGSTDMPAPSGWRWVRLLDVARLESGHTPSRKVSDYWDGEFPWIGIKDAREHHGGVIQRTLQTVTQAGLDNSAARLLPPGTVCLSRTASVGYTLIMGETMATSQDFVNWVCSDELAPEFLMYLFLAEKESLLRFGKGTTHTTIYYPEVKAFHVCLPNVDEQRSIVSALDSYFSRLDDAVASLERVQRNLKRYRASVLKAAVEGRLVLTEAELARAEGSDYEPASVLLERILAERRRRWEEAELEKMLANGKPPNNDKWKAKYKGPAEPDLNGLPELPEGWCWASLDQVAVWGSGGTPKRDRPEFYGGNIPWAVIGDLTDGPVGSTESTITQLGLAGSSAKLVPADSVLLAMYGSIGKLGISTIEMATNQAIAFARPCVLTSRMLFVWLLAHRQQLVGQGKGGTQQNISQTVIKATVVPLPPKAELARIVDVVDSSFSRTEQIRGTVELSATRIDALRSSMLRSAFKGRLMDAAGAESTGANIPVSSSI